MKRRDFLRAGSALALAPALLPYRGFSQTASSPLPPRNVEYTSLLPSLEILLRKASNPFPRPRPFTGCSAFWSGKSGELVRPAMYALPAESAAMARASSCCDPASKVAHTMEPAESSRSK